MTELVSDLFTPIQTPTTPAPAKVPVMMSLFGLVSLSYIGFTKKNEHK
ncbi:5'-nucleotidase [Streptococcus parauberis]